MSDASLFGPPNRQLYLQINTYAPLVERGEEIVRLLERVRADVVEPALAIRPDAQVTLTRSPRVGSSTREYALSDENWRVLLDRLVAGEVGELGVWFTSAADRNLQRISKLLARTRLDRPDEVAALVDAVTEARPAGGMLTATLDLRPGSEFAIDWAFVFEVRCSLSYVGGELTPDVQRRWVGLAKEAARALSAATGYLTYDDCGSSPTSPYESRFTLVPGREHAREYARGYYWGNVLGEEQVRRLGGLESVMRAPCHVVERISEAPEIVYLQLSEDLRDYTDDDLRALRDFLRPVLQPVTKESPYMGPQLRVLDEP